MSQAAANPTRVNVRNADRRDLHFQTLAEAVDDVRRLSTVDLRTTGNRSPTSLVEHLAHAITIYVDGIDPGIIPLPVRVLAMPIRSLLRKRFCFGPMPAGAKNPRKIESAFYPDRLNTFDQAAEAFGDAVARLEATETMPHHPVLGTMTKHEVEQLHCRHAELHLSFIHPTD